MSNSPLRPDTLMPLFNPQSVAILGASSDPARIGGRPLSMLKELGYQGKIYPINPRHSEVQGLPAVPSIADVDGPVDIAIIAVPGPAVIDAVQQCADKGVKAVVIFSSGFAEVDEEGKESQQALTKIAETTGMRIVGPNCIGLASVLHRFVASFSTALSDGISAPGRIGIVSQSGAFGSYCFVLAKEKQIGISYFLTTGNSCDVDISDGIAFMAEDEHTDVIMTYMEGTTNREKFIAALELAQKKNKTVVMLKVGSSDVGAQAAASHTASLVGSDDVYDSILTQYNVYRARNLNELFEIAHAASSNRFPSGNKLGLITVSGGAGILMADVGEELGMDVTPLPTATQKKLKELLPFAGVANPVDVTAQVLNDMSLLPKNLDIMLDEGGYDVIICCFLHVGHQKALVEEIHASMLGVQEKHPDALLMVSLLGPHEIRQKFEASGMMVFEDPTSAVRAAAALYRFGEGRKQFGQSELLPKLPASVEPVKPTAQINEFEAKRILHSAGIRVAEEKIVTAADQAAAAASAMGYPVVMKIVSPDIQHKSEIGGVVVSIHNDAEAVDAYNQIMSNAKTKEPNAAIDGVLVAEMIQGGIETIIGVNRDPVFGQIIMVGLGGIFVEILGDVSLQRAPFGNETAKKMLQSLKGYPLLAGARGQAPADIDALAEAIAQLSVFADANQDTIESIDINPFLVLPEGQGAVAVDALMIPRNV